MDGSHGEMRDCVLRIHHLQSGSASRKLKQADVMHRKKEIKCIIFLLPVISMRQKSCISFFLTELAAMLSFSLYVHLNSFILTSKFLSSSVITGRNIPTCLFYPKHIHRAEVWKRNIHASTVNRTMVDQSTVTRLMTASSPVIPLKPIKEAEVGKDIWGVGAKRKFWEEKEMLNFWGKENHLVRRNPGNARSSF